MWTKFRLEKNMIHRFFLLEIRFYLFLFLVGHEHLYLRKSYNYHNAYILLFFTFSIFFLFFPLFFLVHWSSFYLFQQKFKLWFIILRKTNPLLSFNWKDKRVNFRPPLESNGKELKIFVTYFFLVQAMGVSVWHVGLHIAKSTWGL